MISTQTCMLAQASTSSRSTNNYPPTTRHSRQVQLRWFTGSCEGVDSGGQRRESGHACLAGCNHEVGDQAPDGVAGANLLGCGAFSSQQGRISAGGLVPLRVGHGDVNQQASTAFGGGNRREGQAVRMREGGARVAEQVGGGNAVADDVGGQCPSPVGVVDQPPGGGLGLGKQGICAVTAKVSGSAAARAACSSRSADNHSRPEASSLISARVATL